MLVNGEVPSPDLFGVTEEARAVAAASSTANSVIVSLPVSHRVPATRSPMASSKPTHTPDTRTRLPWAGSFPAKEAPRTRTASVWSCASNSNPWRLPAAVGN